MEGVGLEVYYGLTSLALIAIQQFITTSYNYLFKSYFDRPEMFTLVTIFTYLPMVMLVPCSFLV